MTILEELGHIGLIPVVVIDDADKAVPAARALLDGGICAMEITMRTPAGLESIRRVCAELPDMIVGAGTVLTVAQAGQCREAGARFIVSPGFSPALVRWCQERELPVIPGCVTPSEIMAARDLGLSVLKFFPAGVYGGLAALSALSAPFGDIRFIPTGGVDPSNLKSYADKQFVAAIGGGWLCPKGALAKNDFAGITALAREAVGLLLGFEIAHVGINAQTEEEAERITGIFCDMFELPHRNGNTSHFVGTSVEINKAPGRGEKGHIGIFTNHVERAAYYIQRRGYALDVSPLLNGRRTAVYLDTEIGGFAVHLLQR